MSDSGSSRVFVIGPNNSHDFSSAAKHGTLIKILDQEKERINPYRTDKLVADFLFTIRQQNPRESDIILLCGSMALNAICSGIWVQQFGRIKMLIYEAKTREYVLRDVTLKGKGIKAGGVGFEAVGGTSEGVVTHG